MTDAERIAALEQRVAALERRMARLELNDPEAIALANKNRRRSLGAKPDPYRRGQEAFHGTS